MKEKRTKEEEIWKELPGYEGLYNVNQWGDIYSLRAKKQIKYTINRDGYKQYVITKNGVQHLMMAHRAVALAFIPNPNNYPVINHIDENKLNCHYSNLEWCTRLYNNTYNGVRQKAGLKHRKPVYCYNTDGTLYKVFKDSTEAEADTGAPISIIQAITMWLPLGEDRLLISHNKTFSRIPRSQEEVLDHIYGGSNRSEDPRYKCVEEPIYRCKKCGRRVEKDGELCVECKAKKNSKEIYFTKDDLKRELFRYRSMKKIAKQYGVSDTSIVRWCKKYNLEYKKDVLTNTSDYGILNEQWNDIKEENERKNAEREKRRAENAAKHAAESLPKEVIQIDIEAGEEIQRFPSIEAAARSIGKLSPHIADVCKGRRNKAYGYIWRFA